MSRRLFEVPDQVERRAQPLPIGGSGVIFRKAMNGTMPDNLCGTESAWSLQLVDLKAFPKGAVAKTYRPA